MAGHSKWANIKHRKGRQDAKRGKIFTKLIRELTVAAKGGALAAENPRLRLAVDKALTANMTRDTIDRAIARGAGADEYVHLRLGVGCDRPQFFPVEELLQPQRGAEAEDRVVAAQIGGDQAFDLLLRPQGRVDADAPARERTLAMIFEKASTRTRVSFEAGIDRKSVV